MSKKIVSNTQTGAGTTWVSDEDMQTLKFPVTIQAVKGGTVTDYDVVMSNDGQTTSSTHATIVGASASAIGSIEEPVGAIGTTINTGTGTVTLHIVGS